MSVLPLPFKQLRSTDPGFSLDPDGRATFLAYGYQVNVHVRYTTEDDRTDYSATAEDHEVILFASVDIAGVTAGRSWFLAEWNNPYSLRDAIEYVIREAVSNAENKAEKMAREVKEMRAKREAEALK